MKRTKRFSKHTKPVKPKPALLYENAEHEPGEPIWKLEDITDPDCFTVLVKSDNARFLFDLTHGEIHYEVPPEEQQEQKPILFRTFKIDVLSKANSLLADVYFALSNARIQHKEHLPAIVYLAQQWLMQPVKKIRFSQIEKRYYQNPQSVSKREQDQIRKTVIHTTNGYTTLNARIHVTPKKIRGS